MQVTLTNPWETHVGNGVGILNNPWGLDWQRAPKEYMLAVSYHSETELITYEWDTSSVVFNPAKVLAYPQAYWGIIDTAFPDAMPYPDFVDDLNSSEANIYIDTQFLKLQHGHNNYALESFRYKGLPRKGSNNTTTHEIMVWLAAPESQTIGLGIRIDIVRVEGRNFGVHMKMGESKYLAFIVDGPAYEGALNWSNMMRLAANYFEERQELEAYDPDDKFYSIEAGPEIYGGSVGSIGVRHKVYNLARATEPSPAPAPAPAPAPTPTHMQCEWMSLQGAILQMECARANDDIEGARQWHGVVDTGLASYYNKHLKEREAVIVANGQFEINEKGTHTLGSAHEPYPENTHGEEKAKG